MATPFQALIAQLKALDGAPRVTYPDGSADYPVSERYLKIQRGSHLPTFASTSGAVTADNEPDAGRFPDNMLTEHVELESDHQWVYCYRKYERLPSLWIAAGSVDTESGTAIITRRRKNFPGNIAVGVSVGSDLVITEREGGNNVWANEVETTIAAPSNNSLSTALVSTRTMPYQFPARINIPLIESCTDQSGLGYHQPSARLVEATVKTYWAISSTKPTLTFNPIIPNTIVINDVKYNDVLHDAVTRSYTCGGSPTPVFYPATTPSATAYATGWIGQQKVIAGEVTPTRYKAFWKVEAVYLTMR